MRYARAVTAIGLVAVLTGCYSQWVQRPVASQVSVTGGGEPVEIKDMQRVAILPLADYSAAQSYRKGTANPLNQRILEQIADAFVAKGVQVAVQEDVVGFLVAEGVLRLMANPQDASTIESELMHGTHLPPMQKDLAHYIARESVWGYGAAKTDSPQGLTAPISKKTLSKLRQELGADKVLRGRIIDYSIQGVKTLNPLNGVLSVAVGGFLEGIGGYAFQDNYEKGLPLSTHMDSDLYGDRAQFRPGMELSARERSSHVQLRLYLQDTKTGEVLWSNRAYVQFHPNSRLNYQENHPQTMLDEASHLAVEALMADLFKG